MTVMKCTLAMNRYYKLYQQGVIKAIEIPPRYREKIQQYFHVIMTDKNDLIEVKDAILKEEPLRECKNCHVEFVPKDSLNMKNQELCYLCGAPETVGVVVEAKKSLLIRLFGDTPKTRILDFLIANKGQSFSKTEISRGAHVFKTAFFKQNQGKHYYDHFGDLVRLGVVYAVCDSGRYFKYAIDVEVLKARLKEVVGYE